MKINQSYKVEIARKKYKKKHILDTPHNLHTYFYRYEETAFISCLRAHLITKAFIDLCRVLFSYTKHDHFQ